MVKLYKFFIEKIVKSTGININGNEKFDLKIKNPNFYKRVLFQGSLGLGESYMEEWWECDAIDEFIYKLLRAGLDRKVRSFKQEFINNLRAKFFNLQKKIKSL